MRVWLVRVFWLILIVGLIIWALVAAPLAEMWASLKQLHLWQIGVLIATTLFIFSMITLRWWFIVSAEAQGIPFLPLIGYRMASFGMSYFTLGPQIGGEPLQIHFLRKDYHLSYARATSTVIMDKLLELLVNVFFLATGIFTILRAGMISLTGKQLFAGLIPFCLVMLIPPVHIILIYHRKYPISAMARAIQHRTGPRKFFRLLIVSEHLAGIFTHRHLKAMLAAISVSAVAWLGQWAQYWLMTRFILVNLTVLQAFAGLTLAQIAFLMPLPGGLGALEASQVFALGAMGFPPSAGLTISLLARVRDLILGGLGLLRAGRL
jgi:glycosyltransferase 2 family protein